MYRLCLQRDFIAQHRLIGGDWGLENQLHSHPYRLEVELEGAELDRHGYLTDLVELEAAVQALLDRYRDQTLNDLAEFAGLNPSLERFAERLGRELAEKLPATGLSAVAVRLWESPTAWAGYREARG